jgi:hypothetical protein
MSMNTAFVCEDQESAHHISAENARKTPQEVLIEFKSQGINSIEALKQLLEMGIFDRENLDETLRALLDGIEAQDTRAAVQRYPDWFRDRVLLKSGELVTAGRVTAEDERHLLSLFRDG